MLLDVADSAEGFNVGSAGVDVAPEELATAMAEAEVTNFDEAGGTG